MAAEMTIDLQNVNRAETEVSLLHTPMEQTVKMVAVVESKLLGPDGGNVILDANTRWKTIDIETPPPKGYVYAALKKANLAGVKYRFGYVETDQAPVTCGWAGLDKIKIGIIATDSDGEILAKNRTGTGDNRQYYYMLSAQMICVRADLV